MSVALLLGAAVLGAQISAQAPDEVPVDARIPVHGEVRTADERRVVRLQEHYADGWTTVATERARRSGRFAFDISSGHLLTTRELRVVAPRAGRLPAARSAPLRVRVVVPLPDRAGR